MNTSYLVIWQLGNNEQSRDNTPVDINMDINPPYSAKEKYGKIVTKLKKEIDEVGNDRVTIVGIFKL